MKNNNREGSKYKYRSTPKWNMASIYLERLNERCNERDIYATKGDLLSWYRSLRSIYRNIHFEIRKEGHEEAEEKLNKLFEKALNTLKNINTQREEISSMAISDTEELLDEIDMKLNDLMYEYGLIIPQEQERNMEAEMVEGWFE